MKKKSLLNKSPIILLSLIPMMICFADNDSNAEQTSYLTGTKFGTEASNYTKGRKAFPVKLFQWIKGLVKTDADMLDIGCGTGRVTIPLREHVSSKVTGFDMDFDMLAEAKKNAGQNGFNIPFFQGDVKNLGQTFAEGRFDLITAGSALHWFSKREDFNAIRSVLKPQGLFIVIAGDTEGHSKGSSEGFTKIISETLGKQLSREKTNENDAEIDLEKTDLPSWR